MPNTYYVRKTGSDAAAGTSAGAAWLTIDKAANTVAAGDTVYIGAGTYRELVTMDTSGSAGNIISFIADVGGSQTGDTGLVIISAHSSNVAVPARDYCLQFQDKDFISWQRVIFYGGNKECVVGNTVSNLAYEGVTFETCVFVSTALPNQSYNAVTFNLNTGATPATTGLTFKKCKFVNSGLLLQFDHDATAARNFKSVVENCRFTGTMKSSYNDCLVIQRITNNTFKSGGFSVNNCYFTQASFGVQVFEPDSTTYPVAIRNCTFNMCATGIERWFGTADAVTSDYNRFSACNTARSGVTAGGNDVTGGEYVLLGGLVDHALYEVFGWSPYLPDEPIVGNGLINNGTVSGMPTEDMYGRLRPMGNGSHDVGPVESRGRGSRSSTWAADSSTYSMAFTSIGYHEMMIPIDASSTTVTVKAYKSATYAGTAPKLEVLIGSTSQGTDSMSVGTEVEETLSVNFTPSAAGWARVRLWSYATAGTVYFDSAAVT